MVNLHRVGVAKKWERRRRRHVSTLLPFESLCNIVYVEGSMKLVSIVWKPPQPPEWFDKVMNETQPEVLTSSRSGWVASQCYSPRIKIIASFLGSQPDTTGPTSFCIFFAMGGPLFSTGEVFCSRGVHLPSGPYNIDHKNSIDSLVGREQLG